MEPVSPALAGRFFNWATKEAQCVVYYLLSGQDPASSLDCPAIRTWNLEFGHDILEFLSTGNDPQLLTQWGLIFLLLQSQSKCVLFLATGEKELVHSMGECYIFCYLGQVQNHRFRCGEDLRSQVISLTIYRWGLKKNCFGSHTLLIHRRDVKTAEEFWRSLQCTISSILNFFPSNDFEVRLSCSLEVNWV